MTKIIHRCEFCNSQIDPDDPNKDRSLQLTKKELEEIRKFMAFYLNEYGIFSEKDVATSYVKTQILIDAYKKLTQFLMK